MIKIEKLLFLISYLIILSERPTTVDAYVSGEITTELVKDLGVRLINVPIKGKQGNYGILQISAPVDYIFSTRQKEFAISLAESR